MKYDDTHSSVAGSPGQKIAQPKHEMEYFIYDQQEAQILRTDAEEEAPLTAGEIEVVSKEIILSSQ